MFKLNEKFAVDYCSTCSVILNVRVTQCTQWCLLPPLTRTVKSSVHCSCMLTTVHPPWLPGYIHVMQTILVILTMVGLFPDRPRIWKFLIHHFSLTKLSFSYSIYIDTTLNSVFRRNRTSRSCVCVERARQREKQRGTKTETERCLF